MGRVWGVKLPWYAVFENECEFCGKHFNFNQHYTTQFSSAIDNAMHKKVKEQATLRQKYSDAGVYSLNKIMKVHACPECGYVQSWMIKHAKREKNKYRRIPWLSGFLLLLMLLPLWISLKSPTQPFSLTVQILFACLTALFVFSLYRSYKINSTFDPNAELLKGKPAPTQKKSPTIHIVD